MKEMGFWLIERINQPRILMHTYTKHSLKELDNTTAQQLAIRAADAAVLDTCKHADDGQDCETTDCMRAVATSMRFGFEEHKVQSIVAAASPEEALMTVSIFICDEADLPTVRYEQELILSTEMTGPLTYAYMVLADGPLDDEDMSNLALILSADIDKQRAALSAA